MGAFGSQVLIQKLETLTLRFTRGIRQTYQWGVIYHHLYLLLPFTIFVHHAMVFIVSHLVSTAGGSLFIHILFILKRC